MPITRAYLRLKRKADGALPTPPPLPLPARIRQVKKKNLQTFQHNATVEQLQSLLLVVQIARNNPQAKIDYIIREFRTDSIHALRSLQMMRTRAAKFMNKCIWLTHLVGSIDLRGIVPRRGSHCLIITFTTITMTSRAEVLSS
ncbi:hypothetical protein HBI56_172460 [Parastagonospora nodorum]|nr:hypothetical protein HBH52_208810 [Parastagonospora nodorum]KAH4046263.1 hypothetical protein HBH49_187820 [Parastagonospora nodorum]KAH4114512.1 hypothetical protein HBH47_194940 [Parastagonospora nodorum]KAH4184992.1 hypothetical protein HBH42_182780 [Parastagonospora nodorum]KAH4201840.1 hypothetical protein HBI95_163920 [Parastagonospora nodorum]